MDCSLPGFSVHGIFQAKVLEWGAIAFSSNSGKGKKKKRVKKQTISFRNETGYITTDSIDIKRIIREYHE